MGLEDLRSLKRNWYVGVILSLLGAVVSACGYVLQRWSHQKNDTLPTEQQIPPYKQWRNILGVALLGVEALMEAVALNFAAESLIASLGCASVVLNLILAPRLLGEKMHKGDMVIAGLVTVGTSLCVFFSSHSEADYTWDDLYAKFFHRQFIFYAFALIFISLFLLSIAGNLHLRFKRLFTKKGATEDGYIWSPGFTIRAKRVALPTVAAICAGFVAMFGKATVELVSDTIEGDDEFRYFGSWMIPLAALIFLFFQVRFLNRALHLYSALSIVPFYETLNTLFGILNGAFYYRDFDEFTPLQATLFPLGIVINGLALVMLMRRPVLGGDVGFPEMELIDTYSTKQLETRNSDSLQVKEEISITQQVPDEINVE
jgi:hypothetical protein